MVFKRTIQRYKQEKSFRKAARVEEDKVFAEKRKAHLIAEAKKRGAARATGPSFSFGSVGKGAVRGAGNLVSGVGKIADNVDSDKFFGTGKHEKKSSKSKKVEDIFGF